MPSRRTQRGGFFTAFAFYPEISRSAPGVDTDMVSKAFETLALPRSTAYRNWNKSFEPTETKSTLQQLIELIEQRRHLDHGADVGALRQRMAVLSQMISSRSTIAPA